MKDKITGWKDVFLFTFVRTMEEKSTKISLIILCAILFLSMPVVTLIKNQMTDKDKMSNISTIYIKDETPFAGNDYSVIREEQNKYSKVEFQNTNQSIDELSDLIVDNDKDAVILHILEEDNAYQMHFIKNPKGGVKDKDLEHLTDIIKARFDDIRVSSLQITKTQYDMAYAKVKTNVYVAEKDGVSEEKKSVDFTGNEKTLLYVLAILPFMFIVTGGSAVAGSIVTEKSSKVIEYLMISIKPLAIIMGKVLAMFLVLVVQFGLMGLSLLASNIVTDFLFEGDVGFRIGEFIPEVASYLSAGKLILIIFVYLFGFLFYCVFASLFGATVSKVEELQEGLSVYTITAIIGFYFAYILIGMNTAGTNPGTLIYVASLLPISAPFIAPAYLLFGKISILVAVASLAIQVIIFILLILFVSKIYETLILHNGNRVKLKELITIFKNA